MFEITEAFPINYESFVRKIVVLILWRLKLKIIKVFFVRKFYENIYVTFKRVLENTVFS